jgi:hypothetical protein
MVDPSRPSSPRRAIKLISEHTLMISVRTAEPIEGFFQLWTTYITRCFLLHSSSLRYPRSQTHSHLSPLSVTKYTPKFRDITAKSGHKGLISKIAPPYHIVTTDNDLHETQLFPAFPFRSERISPSKSDIQSLVAWEFYCLQWYEALMRGYISLTMALADWLCMRW